MLKILSSASFLSEKRVLSQKENLKINVKTIFLYCTQNGIIEL